MTAKDVRYFYSLISSTYNRKEPNEAEAKSWVDVLSFFNYSDLDAAWRRWQNDTEVEEFTNRPRGARMPNAAELKASIEQQRLREIASKSKFIPCGKNGCASGWIPVNPEMFRSPVKRCECWHDHIRGLKAGA